MIDVSKINTDRVNEPKLVFLENVSGNINLSCDKIYVFEVLNNINFILPTIDDVSYFHQIKVTIKIIGTPIINLGTTYFFNKQTPELEEGVYDIYFDYDVFLNDWVCAAISKGLPE